MDKIIRIVKENICSGCGVCVSVCPKKCFNIEFRENGQYYPKINKDNVDKCINCHLCSNSCSFINNLDNKLNDEVANFNYHVGYYLNSYVGYVLDENTRLKSASGGITTALLKYLLNNKIVDYVIAAKQISKKHPIIESYICKSEKDIENCSSSFYYPLTYSKIIDYVLCNEGKYAIVGLPCVLKSISLSKKYNKKLRDRIVYSIGLVCGSNKSAAYLDFLQRKYTSGNKNESINHVNFRTKTKGKQSSFYCTTIETDSNIIKVSPEMWGKYWSLGAFNIKGCSYCTDVFSECADIVFMDAWSYPYVKEYKGTNFIVTRNSLLDNIIKKLNDCNIKEVKIEDVVYSQKYFASPVFDKQCYNLYNINKKRDILFDNRFKFNNNISIFRKVYFYYKNKSQQLVSNEYKINEDFNFTKFNKKLNYYIQINRILSLIFKVENKIRKITKGKK